MGCCSKIDLLSAKEFCELITQFGIFSNMGSEALFLMSPELVIGKHVPIKIAVIQSFF